jgi:hypothetical protein
LKPLPSFKLKKKVNTKGLECLNCGMPMHGHENFCSYCGQKNTIKSLSFGVFLNNMVSGFFSYDSRFWRTFIPLLTKPGSVSKHFIKGKRVRFVNPFQLYLNVSIVFFIILGISDNFSGDESFKNVVKLNQKVDSIQENTKNVDSLMNVVQQSTLNTVPKDSTNAAVVTDINKAFEIINKEIKKDSARKKKPYVYHIKRDSSNSIAWYHRIEDFQKFHKKNKELSIEQSLDSLGYEKSFWNKFHYQRVIDLSNNLEQLKKDGGKSFYKNLTSKISIALFAFLPIFTLFLWLLYVRRKFTYMEHLVFVFHTQTVFFLLLIIFYFIDFFIDLNNFSWVFIILFLIYLYKALRHFYGQGRFKTFIKFIILNTYYMFLATIGVMITMTIVAVMN